MRSKEARHEAVMQAEDLGERVEARSPAPEAAWATAPAMTPDTVELVAQRVAELLRDRTEGAHALSTRMLTPAELAHHFGVKRTWVYQHADELGGLRIGKGRRARLRFDFETARTALATQSTTPRPTSRKSPSTSSRKPAYQPRAAIALLPVTPRRALAPTDSGTQREIEDR